MTDTQRTGVRGPLTAEEIERFTNVIRLWSHGIDHDVAETVLDINVGYVAALERAEKAEANFEELKRGDADVTFEKTLLRARAEAAEAKLGAVQHYDCDMRNNELMQENEKLRSAMGVIALHSNAMEAENMRLKGTLKECAKFADRDDPNGFAGCIARTELAALDRGEA